MTDAQAPGTSSIRSREDLNSICRDCTREDCTGTTEKAWTGCIYRRTEGKQ